MAAWCGAEVLAKVPGLLQPFDAVAATLGLAFVPHIVRAVIVATTIGYNNISPREALEKARYLAQKDGTAAKITQAQIAMIARCKGCHENGLEAFTFFSVAVLCAVVTRVNPKLVSSASTLFVAARVLYNPVYIWGTNQAIALVRTFAYVVAMWVVSVLLFSSSAAYTIASSTL